MGLLVSLRRTREDDGKDKEKSKNAHTLGSRIEDWFTPMPMPVSAIAV